MNAQLTEGPCILVVDDSASSLEVLQEYLQQSGYRVELARDGIEGVRMAAESPPDLILLDVIMPGIDGFETCRRIKANHDLRDIPLIFMTSLSNEQFKVNGFEAGAVDYLTKPLQMKEVLARVQTHISLHAMRLRLAAKNTALKREMAARTDAARALVAESESMASLGRLVTTLAHDINAPVGMALTASTVLDSRFEDLRKAVEQGALRRSDLDRFLAEGSEICTAVSVNLQRAGELVSRLRAGPNDRAHAQRHCFDLGEKVREVMHSMDPHLKQRHIAWKLESDAPLQMDGYSSILARILTNLTANAEDHAFDEGGGMLTVRIAPMGKDRVLLAFSDDGRGIPAVALPNIFNAFFTTRGDEGNSGLGMHIIQTLVMDILGGKVNVASEVGQGTTVRLELPLSAPALPMGS
ncbi:MAG: hybrid sensor histidine kinase/response regulator [Pseudomonadota bacterium]